MSGSNVFDRRLVRARTARVSRLYGEHDFLARHAALELVARAGSVRRSFSIAADIGSWNGIAAQLLRARYPALRVVSFAESLAASHAITSSRAVADAEALPLKDGSVDLAISILSLQLVNDLPGALVQIRRALKPDGLFLGALLGGATLCELRDAFTIAEMETAGGVSPRVFPTADVRDMGGLLHRAGFALPVADIETLTVTYAGALALMKDVRGMGGANALVARSRRSLRRDTLARAVEIYAGRFPAGEGRVKATFDILYLTGWAPHASQQKPLQPGSAALSLADALGTVEMAAGDKADYAKRPRSAPAASEG